MFNIPQMQLVRIGSSHFSIHLNQGAVTLRYSLEDSKIDQFINDRLDQVEISDLQRLIVSKNIRVITFSLPQNDRLKKRFLLAMGLEETQMKAF